MNHPQSVPGKGTTSEAVRITRNGLTVDCFFSASGQLRKKVERWCGNTKESAYQFDAKGRLTKVSGNGILEEEYRYNQAGQRTHGQRHYQVYTDSGNGSLRYDTQGRLIRAGDTMYEYDARGSLSERRDRHGVTRFFYGKDTMLDRAILPSREEIAYQYDKADPSCPVRRFKGGELASEYTWLDRTRLAVYRDYEYQLEYTFSYDASGQLHTVRIKPVRGPKPKSGRYVDDYAAESADWLSAMVTRKSRNRLHELFPGWETPLELFCGCDQVGTLKVLTDRHGRLVKEILFDSFGVVRHDSLPDLFMPIGFAGGLVDRDTGLVRFGYRDYEPGAGRFVTLDPARDRRGDNDLYDYCVDDPVGRIDPEGLRWTKENFDESKVSRDDIGRFASGGGGGIGGADALSGGTLYAAAANVGTATDAGGGRQESIQALPKAPTPIPINRPLTRFEELAIKEKLADRETLPQYYEVTSGASLNAGHSKGFETRDLRASDDILVYVKNRNVFGVALEVKAGPSFAKSETQARTLAPVGLPGSDRVLRFRNHGQLTRYLSIDSQADSFLVEYQVFSRGSYAPR